MEISAARAPLTIQLTTLVVYAVATLDGELTFSNHGSAEERLFEGLDMTRAALIVDMTDLSFCDSAGLNSFIRLLRRANAQGKTVVLVGLADRVFRIFHLTGMDGLFPLHPDVDTAFRWLEQTERPSPRAG